MVKKSIIYINDRIKQFLYFTEKNVVPFRGQFSRLFWKISNFYLENMHISETISILITITVVDQIRKSVTNFLRAYTWPVLHVLNSGDSSLRSRSLVFWVEQTNHFLMQRESKISVGPDTFIYKKMLRNNEEFQTSNNSKIFGWERLTHIRSRGCSLDAVINTVCQKLLNTCQI